MGGGNNFNRGNGIALDGSGNIYIAGHTYADDFPVLNPAFGGYNANSDGFISKLNSTGTALIYSTYIGGSNFDYLQGLAVDSTGAAWATGNTTSIDFPLLAPYQNALAGSNDAVVVKLSPSGTLVYSTYLGTSGYDSANFVAVDPTGNAYVTGQTGPGFPTTSGVYQPTIAGGGAAFVTKFSSSGSITWSTFVHGDNFEYANGIAVDEFGNSYISGVSYSSAFPGAPPNGAQSIESGQWGRLCGQAQFYWLRTALFHVPRRLAVRQADAIAVDPITGPSCYCRPDHNQLICLQVLEQCNLQMPGGKMASSLN